MATTDDNIHALIEEQLEIGRNVFLQIVTETDRAVAIIVGTFLEDLLEGVLRSRFVNDKKVLEGLFDIGRPLKEFSTKNRVAYSMGLYPKEVYTELDKIARIRNEFAHRLVVDSFEHSRVKDKCLSLDLAMKYIFPIGSTEDRKIKSPKYGISHVIPERLMQLSNDPRERYIETFYFLRPILTNVLLNPSRPT